jgi:hypothetical protein
VSATIIADAATRYFPIVHPLVRWQATDGNQVRPIRHEILYRPGARRKANVDAPGAKSIAVR